jgi:hypothetical protein
MYCDVAKHTINNQPNTFNFDTKKIHQAEFQFCLVDFYTYSNSYPIYFTASNALFIAA